MTGSQESSHGATGRREAALNYADPSVPAATTYGSIAYPSDNGSLAGQRLSDDGVMLRLSPRRVTWWHVAAMGLVPGAFFGGILWMTGNTRPPLMTCAFIAMACALSGGIAIVEKRKRLPRAWIELDRAKQVIRLRSGREIPSAHVVRLQHVSLTGSHVVGRPTRHPVQELQIVWREGARELTDCVVTMPAAKALRFAAAVASATGIPASKVSRGVRGTVDVIPVEPRSLT